MDQAGVRIVKQLPRTTAALLRHGGNLAAARIALDRVARAMPTRRPA